MKLKTNKERVAIRSAVLEMLELISSKEKQIEYQNNVPIAQVSAELFCGWTDIYLFEEDPATYAAIFSSSELKILNEFDAILNSVSVVTAERLPSLEEFLETSQWKRLSSAAADALKKLSELKWH